METLKFNSPKEMVNWLMDNHANILSDSYGRKWKYVNYKFFFKDIGLYDEFEEGIYCLHLFGTNLYS